VKETHAIAKKASMDDDISGNDIGS